MRAVFGKSLSEKVVSQEVRRLSRKLRVDPPGIVFWSRGDGRYDFDTQTVNIPSIPWVVEYEPDIAPEKYWTLVIHELAHHLAHQWRGELGHGDNMYALMVGLILYLDLPLEFLEEEVAYKPLSFKGGKRYAGTQILVNLMGK